jgi:hypothetical protein
MSARLRHRLRDQQEDQAAMFRYPKSAVMPYVQRGADEVHYRNPAVSADHHHAGFVSDKSDDHGCTVNSNWSSILSS